MAAQAGEIRGEAEEAGGKGGVLSFTGNYSIISKHCHRGHNEAEGETYKLLSDSLPAAERSQRGWEERGESSQQEKSHTQCGITLLFFITFSSTLLSKDLA